LAKFRQICRLQGAADPSRLPVAKFTAHFTAASDGFIARVQCEQVGLASLVLGAGRNKQDDVIDHAAGLELRKKPGHAVRAGEEIATLHYNDPSGPAAGGAAPSPRGLPHRPESPRRTAHSCQDYY
jgi:pyrimidine-nucleoside phosphorylase